MQFLENDFLSIFWFVFSHILEWVVGAIWVVATPL